LIYFRLSKAGYGSINEIKKMEARVILQALHYEGFCADYDNALIELNKDK